MVIAHTRNSNNYFDRNRNGTLLEYATKPLMFGCELQLQYAPDNHLTTCMQALRRMWLWGRAPLLSRTEAGERVREMHHKWILPSTT